MNGLSANTTHEWYTKERALYERLADSVRSTLLSAITHADIPLLSVTARAKETDSFLEKIDRKRYRNPREQMTDLAGIRVIVFTESDVNKVCELVRSAFNVHPEDSLDKRSELGKDRFGYRSVHFVCDIGGHRDSLPENAPFKNRTFEIQVRTVLQHAWAEIEHDRGYKFAGSLPTEFERRLYSQAAILEAVDREFDRLSQELDEYAREVKRKTAAGELNVGINTASLTSYMPTIIAKMNCPEIRIIDRLDTYNEVIAELSALGIYTLAELDVYFSVDALKALSIIADNSDVGLIRDALMYADLERYFNEAKPKWNGTTSNLIVMLSKKYDSEMVQRVFEDNQIDIDPSDLLF